MQENDFDQIQAENDLLDAGASQVIEAIKGADSTRWEELLKASLNILKTKGAKHISSIEDLDELEMEKILSSTPEQIADDIQEQKKKRKAIKRASAFTTLNTLMSMTADESADALKELYERMHSANIPFAHPGGEPHPFVSAIDLFAQCGIEVKDVGSTLNSNRNVSNWGQALSAHMMPETFVMIENLVFKHYAKKTKTEIIESLAFTEDGEYIVQDSENAGDPEWASW